ncbi:precorrin-6x reductase [Tepiditoga spiralis]|uniref:Precorrin-6x reductase n=1 Tax=Tepiditoga spiralis TaxID=2108365 RepID=A0A7G1G889_9BACT|nr:precorrin-6A/cobalt-precorrin-6A reductase [Tepiditoga spiralis]BBE31616.1 precorrin-6x reductase [Tepiditoga spiralis]
MSFLVLGGTSTSREFCLKTTLKNYTLTLTSNPIVKYPCEFKVSKIKNMFFDKKIIVEFKNNEKINDIDMIIDFTHPHAMNISNLLKNIPENLLIRYQRKPITNGMTYFDMVHKIKENKFKKILSLLGANGSLKVIDELNKIKYFPEIIIRSIKKVEGFEHIKFDPNKIDNELNEIIKFYKPDLIIFKDSGKEGKTDKKIKFCLKNKIPFFVIKMPLKEYGRIYYSLENILKVVDNL